MVSPDKTGNERYRGFLPDILKKLQQRLHFQYQLYEVEVGSALTVPYFFITVSHNIESLSPKTKFSIHSRISSSLLKMVLADYPVGAGISPALRK